MSSSRSVTKIVEAREISEGEGAKVRRAMGGGGLDRLDPFLLLDEFDVSPPGGFPNHPHRGFQTVTYMLEGRFRHEDNKGHKGTIGPGDVQWMTAGRGVIHSEYPATKGANRGLQLWVNLASRDKMIPADYQELSAKQIPEANNGDGVKVKVIAGSCLGVDSPVFTLTPTLYLDCTFEANAALKQPVESAWNAFVYVLEGNGYVGPKRKPVTRGHLAVLSDGKDVLLTAGDDGMRVALIAGKPIGEPVVAQGPMVMNTDAELKQAFADFKAGKFTE